MAQPVCSDDPPALRIDELVRSEAAVPSAFLLGHHPAFLATEGARIDLPDQHLEEQRRAIEGGDK